jgi:hypothetical protein
VSPDIAGRSDLLVWDDAEEGDHEVPDPDPDLVRDRVLALDGDRFTLVTVMAGEAHLAVGGDARTGVVAYATFDGETFHQLVRSPTDDGADAGSPVRVVAGGQPGDHPRRAVVEAASAVSAATEFARTGRLADGLDWLTG